MWGKNASPLRVLNVTVCGMTGTLTLVTDSGAVRLSKKVDKYRLVGLQGNQLGLAKKQAQLVRAAF